MPDRPQAAPVFVDPTGRRRRTIRMTAIIGAGTLLGVGALLVVALLGSPIAPTASLPEPVPSAPPAGNANPQQPPVVDTSTQPSPTSPRRPAERQPDAAPATTTPTSTTTTTTTAAKGKPGHTPPGRPTDLPTPPGHTR